MCYHAEYCNNIKVTIELVIQKDVDIQNTGYPEDFLPVQICFYSNQLKIG